MYDEPILEYMFDKLLKRETVFIITADGYIAKKKAKRDSDGTFKIAGHRYVPSKKGRVHIFVEGIANEVEKLEIVDNGVKIVFSDEIDPLIKNINLRMLSRSDFDIEKELKNYLYITIFAVLIVAVLVFILMGKLDNIQQQLEAMQQLVQTAKAVGTPPQPVVP